MPGFKGVKGPEIKMEGKVGVEGEVLDAKVLPFAKALPEAAAPGGFQPSRESGLAKFIDIGEKGYTFDLKENKNLERYLEKAGPVELTPLRKDLALVETVSLKTSPLARAYHWAARWMNRILDFIGSRLGGGFGGPMMIFAGFLNGPKGANGGEKAPINLKLVNDFQSKLREFIITSGKDGYFRNSPTSPLENIATVYLTFDVETSAPVLSEKPIEGAMPIHAYRDQRNVIFMDPASDEILRKVLEDPRLNEQQRSALYALSRLHGKPLYVEGNNALSAPIPSGEILPSASRQNIEAARSMFLYQNGSSLGLMATIMMQGTHLNHITAPSLDIMVGTMYLSEGGNVSGVSVQRPAANSPRGTEYQKGVLKGTPVHIVVDTVGNIFHYELPAGASKGLNPHQEALMQGMVNHPENRRVVQKVLGDHPYTVDFALGRGMYRLFDSLNWSLGRADTGTYQIQIYEDGAGSYRFVNSSLPAKPSGKMPVGVLEIQIQAGARDPKLTWTRLPGKLDYRLMQGSLPEEVGQLLSFLKAKFESTKDRY